MQYSCKIDEYTGLRYLICQVCKIDIHPWESYTKNNEAKCPECAFKNGDITELEFCNYNGSYAWFKAAGINPITGEIEYTSGKTEIKWVGRGIVNKKRIEYRTSRGKFTWEMTDNEARRCARYKYARKSVLERDGYKCVDCSST